MTKVKIEGNLYTLTGLSPRGLTKELAAAYVGLSTSAFDAARSRGEYPGPTLPGGRYDRFLLDQAMTKLSGIQFENEVENPLDSWRVAQNEN